MPRLEAFFQYLYNLLKNLTAAGFFRCDERSSVFMIILPLPHGISAVTSTLRSGLPDRKSVV